MRYYLTKQNGEEIVLELAWQDRKVSIDDQIFSLKKIGTKVFIINKKGLATEILKIAHKGYMSYGSDLYTISRGFKPAGSGAVSESSLITQMPGKIVKVLVSPGDKIHKGQTLLILEAMKMENEIKCSRDGVVSAVYIQVGDIVESGHLMMELKP